MELGIIGLARSGKSTVFNTLTRGRVSTASGATAKSNIGAAKVPDERLGVLAGIFKPKRVINAEVQYIDLLNTPEGLGKDQGIGGEYFNVLQRVDALVHVVRAFEDPTVPHIQGNVDPLRDIATLDLELTFSDVAILERRLERLDAELKGAKAQERDRINRESALLDNIKERLLEETPLREQELTDDEKKQISALQLLTAKPLLVLLNVGEDQLSGIGRLEADLQQEVNRPNVSCVALCGRLEEELSQMDEEEEAEFRKSLNAGEPGHDKVVQGSYRLLGLVSFLTGNLNDVRAWPIPRDTPAVQAAGRIHSDMERGFIRAEVVPYDDLVECGSLAEARRRGLLRVEGKGYPVQDGDVIHFLFNV